MEKTNLSDIKGIVYPAGRLSRVVVGDNGLIKGNYFVQGFSDIFPDGGIPEHSHAPEETYFILSGSGEMTVEGETFPVKKGDLILVRSGEKHGLHNNTSEILNIMYTYAPNEVVDHWAKELSGELK